MKIYIEQDLFEPVNPDKVILITEYGTEITLTIGERIHIKQFGTCYFQNLSHINDIIYIELMQIGESGFIDPTPNYLRVMLTDEFIEENFGISYENDNFCIVDIDIDQLL